MACELDKNFVYFEILAIDEFEPEEMCLMKLYKTSYGYDGKNDWSGGWGLQDRHYLQNKLKKDFIINFSLSSVITKMDKYCTCCS